MSNSTHSFNLTNFQAPKKIEDFTPIKCDNTKIGRAHV